MYFEQRLGSGLSSSIADVNRLCYAILCVAVFSAKSVRIYSQLPALAGSDLVFWGPSFYAQDVLFLLSLRFLIGTLCIVRPRLRMLATGALISATSVSLSMAAASISFFAVTGSDMHWRNMAVVGDLSGLKMMRTAGIYPFIVVSALILGCSWIIQDLGYNLANLALHIIWQFLLIPLRHLWAWPPCQKLLEAFVGNIEDELEHGIGKGYESDAPAFKGLSLPRLIIGAALLVQFPLALISCPDTALDSLTWTLPLMPLADFWQSATAAPAWSEPHLKIGDVKELRQWNLTAMAKPPPFSWLPKNAHLAGFEDWYQEGGLHYLLAADPLAISNSDGDLLQSLRRELADVNIRHVMVIMLESTRNDVFPISNDGLIWESLARSYPNKTLPVAVMESLRKLTSTAELLTGEMSDHSEQSGKRSRGSIRASNAYTTATYTLKSLIGTLCGVTPLVADFNAEVTSQIYQPCLPQIFTALDQLDHDGGRADKDFRSYKWKSAFLQSVTDSYDQQGLLMSTMGFSNSSVITKEYLRGTAAKFGPVEVPDINYYGMPEEVLEEYIRDAFAEANKNNQRLFLTHLTSSTHHPFEAPQEKGDTSSPDDRHKTQRDLKDLSKYLNAVGYVDRWLGKILNILEEQNASDETLVVVVGDHGLSIVEDGGVTPYGNPHAGNFHVPLILSHPKLPDVEIKDAVVSSQILPTILDLLLETKSLPKPAARAAYDLIRNYEGQSLLRPLRNISQHTGQGNWQFTVMNPGRAVIAVRDARQPDRRLVMPLLTDQPWRFTDTKTDALERKPILAFAFDKFLAKIEHQHGSNSSQWVEEAVFVSRWWVEENHRRWRYDATKS